MSVLELIQVIRDKSQESHDAALAIGLLIEREKVNRPMPGDDGGIAEILGKKLASQRLSETDLETALNELISYVNDTPEPEPMAIWALNKSYDLRIIPTLINVLKRTVHDPKQENLACQALFGLINIGISSKYKSLCLEILDEAAKYGHGEVKDTASNYLAIYNSSDSVEDKK